MATSIVRKPTSYALLPTPRILQAQKGQSTMPTKARGAIARSPGQPVHIEEFMIDDPGPNEILVRILASGV